MIDRLRAGARLARSGRPARGRERGQSLVEFSLVATPLVMLLTGIIQLGFVFTTYVTLANSVREAARDASIAPYDRTCTKVQNDVIRNERIRTTLLNTLNGIRRSAPAITTTAPSGSGCTLSGGWTQTAATTTTTTWVNGDLTVTYEVPADVADSDARTGSRVTVTALYHQDVLVPMIAALLPRDAGGRIPLTGTVTMIVN